MLTPIRIRGRRKRPTKNASDSQRKQSEAEKLYIGCTKGRRLMSREEILVSSRIRAERRGRMLWQRSDRGTETESVNGDLQGRKPRKLSILESLPVELIQKIFLYSLNMNLPLASAVLNSSVSSERIYRALILRAFWDDDADDKCDREAPGECGRSQSEATISKILRPLDYMPLSDKECAILQAMVLRCRWCTLSRLLSHLPDLLSLAIQSHWVSSGIRMVREEKDALYQFLACGEGVRIFEGVDGLNIRHTLSVDPLFSITISNEKSSSQHVHHVLNVRSFPEKLLSANYGAGFSAEDSAFLEVLRVASGFNRFDCLEVHDVSLSREALQQGIHTALTQLDLRALRTLLKIDEYFFRARNIGLSVPYTLPSKHFRTAIQVSPSDPALFQLLLRASAESVPDDDPEITQWAMDIGPPLGNWLLDLMVRRPELIEKAKKNPTGGSVFYLGRVNPGTGMGRRYLQEVLDAEDLQSWAEECDLDTAELWRWR